VHGQPGQPPCPVHCYLFGGGLLQRLIGEQPPRRVSEFGCGPSPQQRGLHQDGGTVTKTVTRCGDISNEGLVGQPKAVDLGQVSRARVGAQVGDVGSAEGYDGLTPVTMTL